MIGIQDVLKVAIVLILLPVISVIIAFCSLFVYVKIAEYLDALNDRGQ